MAVAMIASNNPGNANSRSDERMMMASTVPRRMAAITPRGTPMTAATTTATTPTARVIRAPTMIWESTSRPNRSVPNQCWRLLDWSRTSG